MTASTATLRKKPGKAKRTASKTAKKTVKKAVARKTAAEKKTTKKAASKKATSKKRSPARTAAKTSTSKKTAKKKTTVKKATRKTAAKKKAAAKKPAAHRSRANVVSGPGLGSAYQSRRGEEYMSKAQLDHFREKLLAWQREIVDDLNGTINHLKGESAHLADPNDRATQESEFALELRTRDRERKLLKKISQALARIADGTYGYCEETGEEIGIARLEIRPVATLCVEAQERRERAERQYVDIR